MVGGASALQTSSVGSFDAVFVFPYFLRRSNLCLSRAEIDS